MNVIGTITAIGISTIIGISTGTTATIVVISPDS
jgi:presenilin-like A22 family membrane protease